MPVTELPKTLVNLLGSLLTENGLLSWQIFDEKSSNIVVKIRFGNGHCSPITNGRSTETVAAYRRKPPSQVRRDRARIDAHKRQQSAAPRMQTRSMSAVCLPTDQHAGDQDSHTSDIEQARYDADVDKNEHVLDHSAMPFEPSQVIDNNSMFSRGDDSSTPCLDALPMSSVACSDTPLQSIAMVISSPSSPTVVIPLKPEHSDISSVCSDISNTSSCDDDTSSPDMPLCDMNSILNILRTEMRSALRPLTDTGISGNPD